MFCYLVLYIGLFWFSAVINGDILFPKDTSVDFQFPPTIRRSSSGVPDGHLRPLGWQRIPEGKVKETMKVPGAQSFWDNYVQPKTPLVIRQGFNKSADCFTKWDDKYLKATYPDLKIEVTTKKPGKIIQPQIMKLKKFLLRYHLEDWYLVNPIPEEMLHQVYAVKTLTCGTFLEYLQEAEMWMSSGGTSSKLHYDADHNLHCIVTGRKDIIMIDAKFKDRFEMEEDKVEGTGFSTIDMEMVNMYEHPKVGKTAWKWTTLWPGDCIFIPAGHMHQVRSYGRGLSISTLWTPTREFNDTGCVANNETKSVPLSDLNFVWKLYNGDRLINTDDYDNPEVLRHHLMSLLRDEPRLPRERFYNYFEKARNSLSRKKNQTPHAAFRQLDVKKKNFLSPKDIKRLPEKLLHLVVTKFIRPRNDEEDKVKDEL